MQELNYFQNDGTRWHYFWNLIHNCKIASPIYRIVKSRSGATRSIYLIITISSMILVALLFWPYMWEGEILGKWASIVTILSLAGAPIAYFTRQYDKEREAEQTEAMERLRASKNLYGEMLDTLRTIRGDMFPEDCFDLKLNDKTVTFTKRFLNHGIYDSLVFSGGIRFLDYDVQQEIQNVFNMIKYHNRYLGMILESTAGDGEASEGSMRYYEVLDGYERRLLKDIPGVLESLEKKFGFTPPT